MEVIDAPEDMVLEVCQRMEDENAYIRFQNVSFSYNKKEPNISNINFFIILLIFVILKTFSFL